MITFCACGGIMNKTSVVDKKTSAVNSIGAFRTAAAVFLLCAVLGWVWEEIYCLIKHGFWVERGFLIGPYLPIYGIGGLLIYMLKSHMKCNPWLLFLTSIGVAGGVEYLGSFALELIYDKRWWDYSGRFLNLNGRVHFFGLLFFGLAGCFAAYVILPPYLRFLGKMNRKATDTVGAALLGIFFSDVAISVLLQFLI